MNKQERQELREELEQAEQDHKQHEAEKSMSHGLNLTKFEEDTLFKITPMLLDQIDRVEIALHDAIRLPMGITPFSAEEFTTDEEMKAAEIRRPKQSVPTKRDCK